MSTAIAMAREGLSEARKVLWALRPDLLQTEPFDRSVERVAKDRAERTGVTAQSHVTWPVRALSSDIAQTLLRCLQEAPANVQKHAKANAVTITMSFLGNEIFMDIQDDGRGFDVSACAPGFGLHGMKERAVASISRAHREKAPPLQSRYLLALPRPARWRHDAEDPHHPC